MNDRSIQAVIIRLTEQAILCVRNSGIPEWKGEFSETFLVRNSKENNFNYIFSLYIHQSWRWRENFNCIGDTMQLWPFRRVMIAVSVPLNTELLQIKHLLIFLGYVYSGWSCGRDYQSVALSFFLKTFLAVGLLKGVRSKNEKNTQDI